MPNPDGSLTAEEFRSLQSATVTLTDDALDLLLQGAWSAILAVCGPVGAITEIRGGGGTFLMLARPIGAITKITERWGDEETELDTDDWEVRAPNALRRLPTGTNSATYWIGDVIVEYTAEDDLAARRIAQAELVKLEIFFNPALALMVVGNFTVQWKQGDGYDEVRESILATLTGGSHALVIA